MNGINKKGDSMSRAKILLVDDDQTFLMVAKKELEDEGYSVETALCGEDALKEIKVKDFDIVFTDLMLPTINGVLLCSAVKKKNRNTQVVLISAFPDRVEGHWENFYKAGGREEMLKKPIVHGQLKEITSKILQEAN